MSAAVFEMLGMIPRKKSNPMIETNTRSSFCSALATIRESSLHELRTLQEEISVQIASRLNRNPLVGDTVYFTTEEGLVDGLVIKINLKTVTVLPHGEKPAKRVRYSDLQVKRVTSRKRDVVQSCR